MFSLIRAVTGGDSFDSHIDDEALELYALGRVADEEQLALIKEHLFVCSACRDRVAGHDEFVRLLRTAFAAKLEN